MHYDRSIKWRGHRPNNWITREHQRADLVGRADHAASTTSARSKWSSPISNRLLAEVSVFTLPVNYNLSFQPDAATRTRSPRSTRSDRIFTGVSPRQDINTARMYTYAGFVSYVTGAHNFKAGVQVRTG